MRTIKFRGFHEEKKGDKEITLNNKKIKGFWVHGDLITDGGCYIGHYAVFPETVGQYANFNDCDGNDLFENDIVRYLGECDNGLIIYNIDCGTFAIVYNSDHTEGFGEINRSLEKIGNIFENPELLEV